MQRVTGTCILFLVLLYTRVLVWFTFSISRTLSCISFRAQWDSASLSLAWTSSFSSCSTKSSLYRELHLCYKVCRNMFSMKHRWFERGSIRQIWSEKYIQMFNIRNTSLISTEALTLYKSTITSIQTANNETPDATPLKQLRLHTAKCVRPD